MLASVDRSARAITWLAAHTRDLLVTLPVLEATACKFFVRAEPLMAMLGACTVYEKLIVSMAALVCGVHRSVANANLLVR